MLTVVYLGVALRLPVKKAKIDKQNTNHDANKKGEVFYITISMWKGQIKSCWNATVIFFHKFIFILLWSMM